MTERLIKPHSSMKFCPMDRKAYLDTLPKKRMAAGCLFRNQLNQILLVKPSYKANWETPGGITEANESPRACAAREVLEELNLELNVGRLLVMDYNSAFEDYTESLMWIFDGGILTHTQTSSIRLPESELEEYRFVNASQLPEFVHSRLAKRLVQALRALENNQTLYLENQLPI
jgi:8-oxo-dGTP diphosphatase